MSSLDCDRREPDLHLASPDPQSKSEESAAEVLRALAPIDPGGYAFDTLPDYARECVAEKRKAIAGAGRLLDEGAITRDEYLRAVDRFRHRNVLALFEEKAQYYESVGANDRMALLGCEVLLHAGLFHSEKDILGLLALGERLLRPTFGDRAVDIAEAARFFPLFGPRADRDGPRPPERIRYAREILDAYEELESADIYVALGVVLNADRFSPDVVANCQREVDSPFVAQSVLRRELPASWQQLLRTLGTYQCNTARAREAGVIGALLASDDAGQWVRERLELLDIDFTKESIALEQQAEEEEAKWRRAAN